MANTGVTGSIHDDLGQPVAGITVAAWDDDGLLGDTLLGRAETDVSGNFAINYPPGAYGLEANPDIVVRVYSGSKHVIFATPVAENISVTTHVVSPITIPRKMIGGLAVTLGGPVPVLMKGGNNVEFLIDNEIAWSRLTESLLAATSSIYVSQLTIDVFAAKIGKPRFFSRFQGDVPQATDDRLEKILVDAAANDLEVLLLLNDFRMFFGIPGLEEIEFPQYPMDTSTRIAEYLKSLIPLPKVKYRRFRMPILNPMHAKMIVIDNREAFTIGSPFLQEYFDDPSHQFENKKRGSFNSINVFQVPIHDVSSRVQGPIVSDLAAAFLLHWNEAGGPEPPIAVGPTPAAEPANMNVQVTRSLRGEGRFSEVPKGEAGILESYLRAIASAKKFIYLEDQYFTCEELCDGLALALQKNPNLSVILLANNKLDVPLYGIWQDSFFNRLLAIAGGPPTPRLGIYTLWTHTTEPSIVRNYVHSKVAIVDDCWVTVGSANCDGASLSANEHIALISLIFLGIPSTVNLLTGGNWNFRNQRSSEMNIAIFNEDGSHCAAAETLRRRLWAEHLGFLDAQNQPNPLDPQLATPANGQAAFALWNDKATEKKDGLKSHPNIVQRPRILPYPVVKGKVPHHASDAFTYLEHLEASLAPKNPGGLKALTKVKPFPLPG